MKILLLPSFFSGTSLVLCKTSDITGHRSAYDTNTGPLALRTKDDGTRARNGHFLASSIVETHFTNWKTELRLMKRLKAQIVALTEANFSGGMTLQTHTNCDLWDESVI